jgi:hypothetical protein
MKSTFLLPQIKAGFGSLARARESNNKIAGRKAASRQQFFTDSKSPQRQHTTQHQQK